MPAPITSRIPFSQAIADPQLLGKLWTKLSIPQQTILLAAYGEPLPSKAHEAAWAILNGNVQTDELGFATGIKKTDYQPKVYSTIVGLIGRRSGKSFITCFAALYEIIFGGHLNPQFVNEGEEVVIPYIAQDLPTARKNMKMIALLCKQHKGLTKYLTKQNADTLEFFGGDLKVQIEPPAIKTGRGWAMPVVIMDEVGFWYKTAENANPDYEVQTAVTASQKQFPNRKQFIISSPYTEEGILYEYFQAGTDGHKLPEGHDDKAKFVDVLVVNAPTACMDNPKGGGLAEERKFLAKERARDPEGFVREYLAKFVTSIDGFLDAGLVAKAMDKGVKERTPAQVKAQNWTFHFVAAMDPAFRRDSFAYSIFHRTNDGTIVQDYLKVWVPDKKNNIILNPAEIMDEIARINKQWGIKTVYSDQGQLESLQQLALARGFAVIGTDFTRKSKPKMYGSLKNLFRTQKIKLLDQPIIYSQLVKLVQKNTPGGGSKIYVPEPGHDDVVSAIALGAEMAIQLFPMKHLEKPKETMWDICMKDIARKQKGREQGWVQFHL